MNLSVTMMLEKKKFLPLTSENICEIYKLLHNEGLVSFPITSEASDKIDSLVQNIAGDSFSIPHYASTEEKVVAHLYFIIKNHAFIDGNKRTATLVFFVLCKINNLQVHSHFNLDALSVFIEQLRELDHQYVIKMLAENLFVRE